MTRPQCAWASAVAALVALGAAPAFAQSLPPGVADCLAAIERLQSAAADAAPEARPAPAEAPLLGDVCPELAEAIGDGPWGEALAGTSADRLGTAAFRHLTELVATYERPSAGELELHIDSLDDSLAALKLEMPAVELTIWERIQRWFDEQFGSRADSSGWLAKWLEHLSPSERVVRYLVIMLGIVLVVATVFVVVNELRVAGVLAGDALRKYSPLAPSASEPAAARVPELDDIARAPLVRRPVLLLALVLERLRARGAAPLRDSLTHRELLGATAGMNGEQSAAFAVVVGAAERVTFGDWRPEEREVDGVLARGRALLASFASDEGVTR